MKARLYQDGSRSILCIKDLGIIIHSGNKLVFASNKKEEILGIEKELRSVKYREIELENYRINDLKEITSLYEKSVSSREKAEEKASSLVEIIKRY